MEYPAMEPLASSHHLESVLPAAKGLSEMVTKALPGGSGPEFEPSSPPMGSCRVTSSKLFKVSW